ncbi:hypothetical protein QR300_32370 [Streptomyces antimycoticus]|nr:hypothetical protein [Streptomyces antimycoticus]WJE00321.1 hypothetical protein QR300_32370 [Streptomyces antimycoticus]
MDQRLARSGQGGDERLHGRAVVAVGRVDHGVGTAGPRGEEVRVVERAHHRLDAQPGELPGLGRIAGQPADVVACPEQADGDGATDVAARAGDEDMHGRVPF